MYVCVIERKKERTEERKEKSEREREIEKLGVEWERERKNEQSLFSPHINPLPPPFFFSGKCAVLSPPE